MYGLLPIFVILLAITIWTLIKVRKNKDLKYIKKRVYATIIVVMFLIHSNITETAFSAFNCQYVA